MIKKTEVQCDLKEDIKSFIFKRSAPLLGTCFKLDHKNIAAVSNSFLIQSSIFSTYTLPKFIKNKDKLRENCAPHWRIIEPIQDGFTIAL